MAAAAQEVFSRLMWAGLCDVVIYALTPLTRACLTREGCASQHHLLRYLGGTTYRLWAHLAEAVRWAGLGGPGLRVCGSHWEGGSGRGLGPGGLGFEVAGLGVQGVQSVTVGRALPRPRHDLTMTSQGGLPSVCSRIWCQQRGR